MSLRGVGVRFTVPRRTEVGRTPRLLSPPRWTLWALRDVTLDVARGEIVGIIGPNGSGKTTLLRTVAGIYVPDEGEVKTRGRVGALLSLAAGMEPELSGWENIHLSAVLLGMPPREAREIAPEVADFAELGEFMDAPVRVYSSGMRARLGFAVAASVEPDILLLDEAMSVGDRDFRARSEAKIRGLIGSGCTVLVSSHGVEKLGGMCHRIVRLDHGRVAETGDAGEVAERYLAAGSAETAVSKPGPARSKPSDRPPTVSVVVAAYDERRHIASCLRSLAGQTYRPLEVIVVDDGSRDGTLDVAQTFGDVKVIRHPHRGAGAARNLGARQATGEILVFLDADMVFPPPFIERLVAPMVERRVVGTFTKDIRVANPQRRWAWNHMVGRGLPPGSHFPPGFPDRWENFRAVWRSDFLRVGGFDEIGHGEDVTLGRKLGALAEAAPGATCYHFEPETLGDILRSARWVGRGRRILEVRRPAAAFGPQRSIPSALRLAVRHRRPSLFVYRVLWDAGVMIGWLTRDRSDSPGK